MYNTHLTTIFQDNPGYSKPAPECLHSGCYCS